MHIRSAPYRPTSDGCIERANQTQKRLIWQYFGQHNTTRYIDVLQTLVMNYNSTTHSATGFKPIELHYQNNVQDQMTAKVNMQRQAQKMKDKTKLNTTPDSIKVGDRVRVYQSIMPDTTHSAFSKGYLPKWSLSIFTVNKIIGGHIHLVDGNGVKLSGVYFPHQLQKVIQPVHVEQVPVIRDPRSPKSYRLPSTTLIQDKAPRSPRGTLKQDRDFWRINH